MPNIESAKKAMRGSARKKVQNNKQKNALKITLKQYKKLIAEGKKEDAKNFLSTVYKKLDKTAKKKVIKKNKANRLKSRLSKLVK
ncbi:30S ribosomal protein S20, partial [Candidatus Wolfebacteria bacterium CG10_big_fil_rev_8_21_14_0_10_31_9]